MKLNQEKNDLIGDAFKYVSKEVEKTYVKKMKS